MVMLLMKISIAQDCETKPDDDKPHGQKCLYHHTGTEGLVTTGHFHCHPIISFTILKPKDTTLAPRVLLQQVIFIVIVNRLTIMTIISHYQYRYFKTTLARRALLQQVIVIRL